VFLALCPESACGQVQRLDFGLEARNDIATFPPATQSKSTSHLLHILASCLACITPASLPTVWEWAY
jgi:hypothetical protein